MKSINVLIITCATWASQARTFFSLAIDPLKSCRLKVQTLELSACSILRTSKLDRTASSEHKHHSVGRWITYGFYIKNSTLMVASIGTIRRYGYLKVHNIREERRQL